MQIMLGLVQKLREADRKIESLALVNVYGRVAQALLEFSEKQGDTLVIDDKLTHQDIARMVGASREMVTRVMRDLVDGEYISIERRSIVLHHKLEVYAQEIGRAHAHTQV
jgi:CRP/FNR family cyclic AMP-dependent transcriptional regulator